jgi:hypothetical protein
MAYAALHCDCNPYADTKQTALPPTRTRAHRQKLVGALVHRYEYKRRWIARRSPSGTPEWTVRDEVSEWSMASC